MREEGSAAHGFLRSLLSAHLEAYEGCNEAHGSGVIMFDTPTLTQSLAEISYTLTSISDAHTRKPTLACSRPENGTETSGVLWGGKKRDKKMRNQSLKMCGGEKLCLQSPSPNVALLLRSCGLPTALL